MTYRGEELEKQRYLTPSAFVSKITGVDNVCERSASLAGDGGAFIMRKTGRRGSDRCVYNKEMECEL